MDRDTTPKADVQKSGVDPEQTVEFLGSRRSTDRIDGQLRVGTTGTITMIVTAGRLWRRPVSCENRPPERTSNGLR
jgi:hypothetical protein